MACLRCLIVTIDDFSVLPKSRASQSDSIPSHASMRKTEHGLMFKKDGQRDVNFGWTEWGDTGSHWMCLIIPYPKTGGPGGSFTIIGSYTPIGPNLSAVFFWRYRRVQGWQRNAWRFLYRNRLEARHWVLLEQDRVMLESMEPDANQREHLYEHDVGLPRLHNIMQSLAQLQLRQFQ